jgi:signal transduction histidine kinase
LNARTSFTEKQVHELLASIYKSGLRLNHSLANLMLFEEIKRAEVYTELLTMFSTGVTKTNWTGKVASELSTVAKEIYNRSADLEVDLEPLEIRINQEYMQRMILELVDNAIKFSKAGSKVTVKGRRQDDDYCIEVADLGRGFTIDSLDSIAPFKQFNRKKFEQQGLGIGLYLVKRLVEFNNGHLKITSVEGEGTKIMISLPMAQEVQIMQGENYLQEA